MGGREVRGRVVFGMLELVAGGFVIWRGGLKLLAD